MSKYRKKPIVIEAFQWTGGKDQTEDPEWIVEAMKKNRVLILKRPLRMKINTLEGQMTAYPGDYIIKGVEGELYPCKQSIFDKTYEEVND